MALAIPLAIPAAEAVWAGIVVVGSAIAVGLGINAASEAIDEEFSDAKPSAVQSCPVPKTTNPPPDCREITAQIQARVTELKQRHMEMLADKHGLYPIRPAAKPPYGSWPGHIQQYRDKRANLRKLLGIARAKGCVIPPDAEVWQNAEPPASPATRIY
jgi:hypothetical protein